MAGGAPGNAPDRRRVNGCGRDAGMRAPIPTGIGSPVPMGDCRGIEPVHVLAQGRHSVLIHEFARGYVRRWVARSNAPS